MRLAKLKSGMVPLFAVLALGVGMAGCSGDDGDDGADGTNGTPGATGPTGPAGGVGPTGPTGPAAKVTPLESCNTCHSDGDAFAAADAHVVTIPEVSNVLITKSGSDLVVTYKITVAGAGATDFTTVSRDYKLAADGTRSDLGDITSAVSTGGGNYSITIAGAAATDPVPNARYMFRVANAANVRTAFAADYPAAPIPALASDESCQNCHADKINIHGGGYGSGTLQCTVCHDSTSVPSKAELYKVVHGVHNSHHMPDGEYAYDATHVFAVTYPTYMTNCEVCHDSASTLAAANSMTVSGEGCLSCHGSMESWEEGFEETGTTFHLAYGVGTECDSCHNATAGAAAPGLVDVRDFHDGLETERIGIIYGGQDLSVVEGKKFNWTITKVVDDATAGTLAISWTAEYPKGTSINPCNETASPTAPVFFPYGPNTGGEGTLSMLRSYAIGDDYVAGTASAPGQASAVNLSKTNTVCSGNVATTTIPRDAKPAGTRAIVALQGKPQLPVPAGMSTEHWSEPLMFVRVPTPTYQFAVGTGTAVTPRRAIADTSACLKCHVGSLYQHGNTRVDNVTMCVICHNSASSDQNNRVAMGVTASEAYDGKVGMTYEFKTLLHKLHKAGRAGSETTVIYRTRGIYAWTPEGTVPANWAVEPCEKTNPTSSQEYRVFGSDPALDVGCQVHNLYHPTYPRPENDCLACHVKGFDQVPDQEKAVATTLDAGAAPFSNQIDDVLQGAGAAGCTSCHQDAAAKGHAYQNGWVPTTFENGRQTIIDEANK